MGRVGGKQKNVLCALAIQSPLGYNCLVWAAGVAQPVEHLICNQRVGGSNPFASSSLSAHRRENGRRGLVEVSGEGLPNLKSTQPCAGTGVCPRPTADSTYLAQTNGTRTRNEGARLSLPARAGASCGQVAERSKAADCKSADPCGLRRFEPSPVHQKNSDEWQVTSDKHEE